MPIPDLPSATEIDVPPKPVQPGTRVVFASGTDGTVRGWVNAFSRTSGEACGRPGLTGLLLDADISTPAEFGEALESRAFMPLGTALDSAVAIVHHGGIGTSAAALEKAISQIIVPRIFMQPINAEWLRRQSWRSI
jgi:rhamnosyltransferase subunit B